MVSHAPTHMNAKLQLNRATLLSAGLLLLLLSACSTTEHGTKIATNKLEQIKKGVTSRAEVEKLLGPPTSVAMPGDGKRILVYNYFESSSGISKSGVATTILTTALSMASPIAALTAGDAVPVGTQSQTRTQTLQIVIDAGGIVEDYDFADGTAVTTAATGGIVNVSKTTTTNTDGK